jgi:hypothetical protein
MLLYVLKCMWLTFSVSRRHRRTVSFLQIRKENFVAAVLTLDCRLSTDEISCLTSKWKLYASLNSVVLLQSYIVHFELQNAVLHPTID